MSPVAEHDQNHIQTSESSTSQTTDRAHAECSTPYVRSLLQAELSQFQAMIQTPTACATARSAIDKEIDAARRFTHSLLSRRNALAPISILPTELLARIFHFYALAEPLWSFRLPNSLGWVTVTHVCQRWRQVALDDTSLWARITESSRSPNWIVKSLVRARNAPLVIDFRGRLSPKILASFRPHISHTRELRLGGLSQLHFKVVQEIFGLVAPTLEHFELAFSEPFPATFHQIAGTALFKGQSPKLRTFSLSQVFIPLSLIPRGQLTQLQITQFKGAPTAILPSYNDLNQLVDLLINSPELEVLVLDFCLPSMLSQVTRGQPIQLPRLSRLHLGGSTSCVANLLKRLILPSSAILHRLHLRCVSNPSTAHNDHIILPLISAHLHNPAPVEFKSLRVAANRLQNSIEVAASISLPTSTTSFASVLEDKMDNEAELYLLFDGPFDFDPSSKDMLGRICGILPMSNIEILSISAPDKIQSMDWYELFQRCKEITTIQAKGRGTSGLLQSLAPPEHVYAPSGCEPQKEEKCSSSDTHVQAEAANNVAGSSRATTIITPFPKLTFLSLENVNFNNAVPSSGALFDVFVNALQQCKTNASPLSTLAIYDCIITADQADSLKKHVREFNWDGHEGSYNPWEDSDRSLDDISFPSPLETTTGIQVYW